VGLIVTSSFKGVEMVEGINYVKAMSGSEIASELGITRQAVSQVLKRAIGKVYRGLLDGGVTESPTKTLLLMRDWFGIETEDDIKQFLNLIPANIRKEIKDDVGNYKLRNN
jgi:predicted transcriptional regulator